MEGDKLDEFIEQHSKLSIKTLLVKIEMDLDEIKEMLRKEKAK